MALALSWYTEQLRIVTNLQRLLLHVRSVDAVRVDTRAGSQDLVGPLRAAGLAVEEAILPAGDIEITGKGPQGRPLLVGCEYKQLRDLLTCVRDGRFAEQLRRMRQVYEVSWLLLEGRWQIGESNLLEIEERRGYRERGRYTYQEVCSWLLTMCQRVGLLVWQTQDQGESVAWLRALHWWWTSKDFEEHRAHLDWYVPPATDEAQFEEPSLAQQWARCLPGIGSDKAYRAGKHFGSGKRLANASPAEWQAIDGIGKKTAVSVVREVERE